MFLVAISIGFLLSKIWTFVNNSNENELGETAQAENLVVINNTRGKTKDTIVMQTASLEEKILPTTKLHLEKKFEDCKHTIDSEVELPTEMINLTQEELAKKYPDWTIKNFSEDEVVLYKLADGLCNEHFLIIDENGVVMVYRLDENYDKILYEKTDIYTEFLPTQDVNRLKEGIYVYTVSDLNSELENLE